MELSMKSRKELSLVTAGRYRKANRKGKTRILDEFVVATGYNRAYAAMLLRNYRRGRTIAGSHGSVQVVATKQRRKAGGRPAIYGKEVQVALEKLWKRFGYLCGKRLVPVIRSSLPFMATHRGLQISAATRAALETISAASVDRRLAAARKRLFLKGLSHTRPVSALGLQIPVRTFSEWDSVTPGHFQLDLVGHDGGIASGEFCFTLSATDVCTGWTERRAVVTKAARQITPALHQMRGSVVFPFLEVHPDNGSEFINYILTAYCREHHIHMTRSRAGRKNDNCYVEQKNFDTVRKLVGYHRYVGAHTVEIMNELYRLHGLLQNYVYPSQKLMSKTRAGSVVHKKHDNPKTPADRLLDLQDTPARVRWNVHAVRQRLDPIAVATQVTTLQRRLISMAIKNPNSSSTAAGATA